MINSLLGEDRKDIENAIVRNIDELITKILSENNITLENIDRIGVASPGTVTNGIWFTI